MFKYRKTIIVFQLFLWVQWQVQSQEITVAVASNVRYVMEEMVELFEKEHGIKVNCIFASSGKLTAQISNAAPYDVFISANLKYPQTLFLNGYATGEPGLLMQGFLVLWVKEALPQNSVYEIINHPDCSMIALANPANAPYGIAASQVLNAIAGIEQKLIYAESISQVNQHIHLGTVDAAFTSKSFMKHDKMKEHQHWVAVDTSLYEPIYHYVLNLKNNDRNVAESQLFITYLSEPDAVELFKKHGYKTMMNDE